MVYPLEDFQLKKIFREGGWWNFSLPPAAEMCGRLVVCIYIYIVLLVCTGVTVYIIYRYLFTSPLSLTFCGVENPCEMADGRLRREINCPK